MKRITTVVLALGLLVSTPALSCAALPSGITFVSDPEEAVLKVAEVLPGTPAALAGLKPGDHILEMDGALVKDLPASDMERSVDSSIGNNRSVLLVYLREGWKAAAWLCPPRLSVSRQATLSFCHTFRETYDQSEALWQKACNAFAESRKGPGERKFFTERVKGWNRRLRKLGRRAAAMEIPSAAKGELYHDLQTLTIGLQKEQGLRTATLALMKDYLERAGDSEMEAAFSRLESPYAIFDRQTFGERRWDRIVEKAGKARRSSLRLQSLFRKVLEGQNLADGKFIDPVL